MNINLGAIINKIWHNYGLSFQTVKQIIMLFRIESNLRNINSHIFDERNSLNQKKVQNKIMIYISKINCPFIVANAQEHLKVLLNVIIYIHQIILFLKNSLGLNFKKESRRPLNLDHSRQKVLKQLYVVKEAEKLKENKLLCNLDESIISSDTTNNYFFG